MVLRRPEGAGLPVSPSSNVMGESELSQPQEEKNSSVLGLGLHRLQFHSRVTSPSRRPLLSQTRTILSRKMMAAAGALSGQSSPCA